MSSQWSRILVVTAVLETAAWAQTTIVKVPVGRLTVRSLLEPPIPGDPLELAFGNLEAVQTPEQRQAAIALLTNARERSNVGSQPYHLVITFQSFGSSASDGVWNLDDISPVNRLYRWTAQGPAYSAINLYNNELLYTNQPSAPIPLRLAQVRGAIFFTYPPAGPYASLRTATGYLDGIQLACVLTAAAIGGRTFSGRRNWEESEYCVDPTSGLLMTYSPAPGVYIRYDYSNAVQFHGKTIPGGFTISESGRPLVQAKIQSVTDPGSVNPAIFDPSGLTAIGVGSMMTPTERIRWGAGALPNEIGALSIVELHGVSSPEGRINELEIVATSDPSLNEAALQRAGNFKLWNPPQNGTTPQSREVYFSYEFGQQR
jgi:hypothetical protein